MHRYISRASVAIVLIHLAIIPSAANATDRLPPVLESGAAQPATSRPWSIADIVEVRRITGTAISDKTRTFAFVVKQSFLDTDEIRYGLYTAALNAPRATKIKEADYMDELAWDPNTGSWTVRADLGAGIQLYEIDASGHERPLVVNPSTVLVGASESVVYRDAEEGPRQTGIASYEWAPDGRSLWYSIYRVRDPAERATMAQRGITFDDREMDPHSFFLDPTTILGAELHALSVPDKSDRILTFIPVGPRAGILFNRDRETAFWEADSRHIHYSLWLSKDDGSVDLSKWSIDARSGTAARLPAEGAHQFLNSVPAPDGDGDFSVRLMGRDHHLVETTPGGDITKDIGNIQFNDLAGDYERSAWLDRHAKRLILAVDYGNRFGLATIPASPPGDVWSRMTENLSHCSLSKQGDGICVRETQTLAPQLVEVSAKTGAVKLLIQLNPRYGEIEQLRVTHREWINRYGIDNDGYLTYPRLYAPGNRYPTLVVTHAHGARNEFAQEGFQWEFPIQVLAERGYLVMSVNEPKVSSASREASQTRLGLQAHRSVEQIQFSEALNPVASMENALDSAIKEGLTDPLRTGIAGYSRGAEIVEWVMTQSKLFHAAVEGDAGGMPAGHYGEAGVPLRAYYRQLYGGSPFDPAAIKNHQRLSVSYRAREFSGPLLQLFAKASAVSALELHSLLCDEGIPTELDFFPAESHIFWDPRHRASAMQDTIDWFDYWLLGKRSTEDENQRKYAHWEAMADAWKANVERR